MTKDEKGPAIDDGGPAYPCRLGDDWGGTTLRVWLAGQALSNPSLVSGDDEHFKNRCFDLADAFVAEARKGRA